LENFYEKLILKRVWSMMGDSLPSNNQHGTYTATTTLFALVNRLIESKN
jgi:hypothetical protein